MKALLEWIDDRTGFVGNVRDYMNRPVPGRPGIKNVWPCCIAFTFVVQAITGLAIWMYYSPSAQTAWESVYYLQTQVAGGWLLRAIHHYSAQVMLVLIGIYLVQMIVTKAYRAPREVVFWLAVLMGMVVLGLLLTGDLLAWDQNSYSSTLVRVGFLKMLPLIGDDLFKLAAGGPEFGHLTLTRFVALHIGVFSGSLLVLLCLHSWLLRRSTKANGEDEESPNRPWWPNQALFSGVACLVVMVAVFALALQHGTSLPTAGVELGAPADPADSYAAARPEWAFRGLYEFSHLFPGTLSILPIFVIPGIIAGVVFLMPFIGKRQGGHLFNLGFGGLMLVGLTALTIVSFSKDASDAEHQAALAAGERQAERAIELAQAPEGIPVGGALELLRNDPKTQGPLLYEANCLSCHSHAPKGDEKSEFAMVCEDPTAPNLYGFASREWLTGLLDPKRIKSAEYFGNTALKKGDMANFVDETLSDLEDEDKADLKKLIIGLSAQAGLKSQREMDAKDAAVIKDTVDNLDFFGCLGCHKFHDKGSAGMAPDLTDYGSREWIMGIVGNPAHKRFYGKKNDRMPAYAGTPPDAEKTRLLSDREIGMLADWLRGEWYEKAE